MIDVRDIELDQKLKDRVSVRLFNPNKEDFCFVSRGKKKKIKSFEMVEFPQTEADVIRKKLMTWLWVREGKGLLTETEEKRIYKLIDEYQDL